MHRRRLATHKDKKPVRGRINESFDMVEDTGCNSTSSKSAVELTQIKIIRADGTEEIIKPTT